jgi:hypothetical protein
MARRQLVLLVTIASLLAPWVVPCLAAAPAGHAGMPCCHRSQSSLPAARACCAPADGQPAVPGSAGAAIVHVAPPAMTWDCGTMPMPRRFQQTTFVVAAAPRHLRTTLLI